MTAPPKSGAVGEGQEPGRGQLRGFALLLYSAAVLLTAGALADCVAGAWPPRAGAAEWRFAAFGLFSTAIPALVLAALLGLAGGWLRASGTVLRALAVSLSLVATLLLVGLVGFGLDLLQVLDGIAPDRRQGMLLRAATAAIKSGMAAVVLFVAAWVGWRKGGTLREAARLVRRRTEHRPLVVGQAD